MQASAQLGLFACWMEDYDTARRELEDAVADARDRGLVSSVPLALSALGELEYRLGNWTAARTHAGEALRLAEDADQFLHYGHSVLLLLDAIAGDADGALAYADIVLTTADRSGSRSLAMHAHAGLGLLQLGLDDPEAAIVHLSRTREIAERGGFGEPNYVQWMGDLVEMPDPGRSGGRGARDAGRLRSAGPAYRPALGARRRRALPRTADRRRRRRRLRPGAADGRRRSSEPAPQLCWGERLRRDGRRIDARKHLHEAHRLFAELGAAPWAEKAARELRSSGGRDATRPAGPRPTS